MNGKTIAVVGAAALIGAGAGAALGYIFGKRAGIRAAEDNLQSMAKSVSDMTYLANKTTADRRAAEDERDDYKRKYREVLAENVYDSMLAQYMVSTTAERRELVSEVEELFRVECQGNRFSTRLINRLRAIRDANELLKRRSILPTKTATEKDTADVIYTISKKKFEAPSHQFDKMHIVFYEKEGVYVDEFDHIVTSLDHFGDHEEDFGAQGAGDDVVYIRNESEWIDFMILRTEDDLPGTVEYPEEFDL